MKKYSLAKCKNNPLDYQIVDWNEFEKEMREQKIEEAIIFILDDVADKETLVKRFVIGELLLSKDNVRHLDEYCLIDHDDNDRLMPCMILLDPELKYAVIKALEFRDNKSFIQCVIVQKDNLFKINECELVKYDKRLNHLVN